ncbi:RNA ligase RtcB family protein [Pseudobacteroides cellulosolvens]|uniref:3'-phosphate/5'-hydroxy nucleic acid ligase n=1 Tax=Pseudobacteroides cellulosolvens ATCC 35603 = DSM 2933 TaxID=398512 RepID=A0A0L6JHH6_9FIRM|nr:RNA ligase RtcB family protein [Pseudobacteroides cellulosolvens]KNY25165.1 release factor H-coupled RctB family protein [Pseudobacteroides cellulosolvens ATCC 35603 = DSM 2933]
MNNLTIISSQKNWLEQDAVIHLKKLCTLEGVVKAAGLPDLHPGKTPVGCTIITEDMIYPHLIGNDIGCGMSIYTTSIEKRKIKTDKIIKKLESIASLKEIELPDDSGLDPTSSPLGQSLGTIGGGNHFAEFQEVNEIFDEDRFKSLGFDKGHITLLVHSGSRGFGQAVLDESIRLYEAQKGLPISSDAARNYLSKHDDAVKWALINRDMISYRILKAVGAGTENERLLDSCHNSITMKELDQKQHYIHRKGASPSDTGAVIIPGSRGSLSYLVMPKDNTETSCYSLAHGAGRKWERSLCKSRLQGKYTRESIKSTALKSRVICSDNSLLFEEAPEAYKNVDTVIQSLLDFELIDIIATFKPIITYKA